MNGGISKDARRFSLDFPFAQLKVRVLFANAYGQVLVLQDWERCTFTLAWTNGSQYGVGRWTRRWNDEACE